MSASATASGLDGARPLGSLALLGSRRFLPLFLAQFLGACNDNLFKSAIVLLIEYRLAAALGMPSSGLVVLASALFILPFLLLSPLCGQLADRVEKSALVRRVKFAEVVVMAFGAAALMLGRDGASLYPLLVLLFLMGAQSAAFGPLKYGILPQHLATGELTAANGLIQAGTYLAILGGLILGGLLIGGEGGAAWVAILVVLMALAGWVASLFVPEAAASEPNLKLTAWPGPLFRALGKDGGVLLLAVCIAWFWFVGATYIALLPSFAHQVLGGDELFVTLLLTCFAVGVGGGSVLTRRLSRGAIDLRLSLGGAAGVALFSIDLGAFAAVASPQVESFSGYLLSLGGARVLLDLVGLGACGGLLVVPLYAAVQHRAAATARARVIAGLNVLNAGYMVGSAIITLVLLKLGLETPGIFLLVGVATLAYALLVLAAGRKNLPRSVGSRDARIEGDTTSG